MARVFDFDLDLAEIIKAGFPARPDLIEFVEREEDQNFLLIIVDCEITYHGTPSNNWDDPGSGCEWFIRDIYRSTQLHCFLPVTDEQIAWLESYLDERVQQADADHPWNDYDD